MYLNTATTPTPTPKAAAVTIEPEPASSEDSRWRRDEVFLPEDEAHLDEFPKLRNISTAFMFNAVVRAVDPEPPEYVTLTELTRRTPEMLVAVAEWNMLWEAAQYRRRFFDLDELPPQMAKVADIGDVNVVFVPRTRSR